MKRGASQTIQRGWGKRPVSSKPAPESKWRPMSTAPTDGMRILIKADNGAPWDWANPHPAKWRPAKWTPRIEVEIGHYGNQADEYSPWRSEGYGEYPIHKPLGWLPLPAL